MSHSTVPAQRTAPVLNLFAKVPVPGQVKTRLIPSVGAAQAAWLAEKFIFYTLEHTTCKWPGERVLWLWPDTDHTLVQTVRHRFAIEVLPQVSGDLGVKMMTALQRDLSQGLASAVMGCDLLHAPACVVAQAGQQLLAGENVFGASEDGGFWLLGLNRSAPTLFDGIDWNKPGSGQATLERACLQNIEFAHRALCLFDIDRPQDLDRLLQSYPQIGEYLSLS